MVGLLLGCAEPTAISDSPPDNEAGYVGSVACAACHAGAYEAWRGSHHQRAMLPATNDSVAGDFADADFVQDGTTSTFSRRGERFLVRTADAKGASAEFRVRYTFGVEPLQQLLLETPGGRLQAFTVAWDTLGKRWFHLRPEHRVGHDDPLHWSGLAYNWNFMCADCHSTAVRKGYDAKTRTYRTEFAEVSVGCEACHGPGSKHIAWATKPEIEVSATAAFAETLRSNGSVTATLAADAVDPDAGGFSAPPTSHDGNEHNITGVRGDAGGLSASPMSHPHRSADERFPASDNASQPPFISLLRSQSSQFNSCAPCHSRREQLADGFRPDQPFLDYYQPVLLEPGLYEADGQILDEVYVYGSFLQSRMHARGVICGDCHEPHSAQLRSTGNALCMRCHNESGNPAFPTLTAAAYDKPDHHLHTPRSSGSQCVACHMPERTYMMIDHRSDHGFRIPRPDLTLAAGVPNACNQCHDERTAEWAQEVLERRFGAPPDTHFATVLAAARRGEPGVAAELAALGMDRDRPAIVRATALSLMAAYNDADTALALESGLRDTNALARIGALRGAARFGPQRFWRRANHLLDDRYRAVRGEAAHLLVSAFASLAGNERNRLQKALNEYLAAQRFNADRPEAQTNMARVMLATGDPGGAEAALKTALSLSPAWVPALVNLADLYRATGRDSAGGELLEQALAIAPEAAEVKLARAFWLVRHNRGAQALPLLATAFDLAPHNPRYAYVYAVALHSNGASARALEVIDEALRHRPGDPQLTRIATGIARDMGDAALRQNLEGG